MIVEARMKCAAIEREANRRHMSYGKLVATLSEAELDKVVSNGVAEMRREEQERRRREREEQRKNKKQVPQAV